MKRELAQDPKNESPLEVRFIDDPAAENRFVS